MAKYWASLRRRGERKCWCQDNELARDAHGQAADVQNCGGGDHSALGLKG